MTLSSGSVPPKALSNIVVLGGCGEVGNLFVNRFIKPDSGEYNPVDITVVDLIIPQRALTGVKYIQVDSDQDLLTNHAAILEAADLVLVALPEQAALRLLPSLVSNLAVGGLLVDTLSVKGEVCSILAQLCREREINNSAIECLSINPMFAPSLGFQQQTVVTVELASGMASEKFLELVKSWGSCVETMSAEEHDNATASLQVATHAAILAFGISLIDSNYDATKFSKFSPPPHRALMALLARICSAEPEVYRDIQQSNHLAGNTRDELRKAHATLEKCLITNSSVAFAELIAKIKKNLGSEQEHLAADCQKMFSAIRK